MATKIRQHQIRCRSWSTQHKGQKKGHLSIEGDEAWSFVGSKGNKHWIWLAMNQQTREIIGVFIADRSEAGAQGLWDSLPAVYRQGAIRAERVMPPAYRLQRLLGG